MRHIQAVHISERIAQKLICQYAIKPEMNKRLIYDNSASIEGKGTEFALKRLKEHLRWHFARYGKSGAIVIMDYLDFFNSIPHAGVINALCEHQDDPLVRHYIAQFINDFRGEYGIGLGSEISQNGAAVYPTPVDRFIKETMRIHCYGRYNDDSYLIHPDRKYAEYCLDEIKKKAAKLGLTIHNKKTKIHNLATDDFEFLKKRVHICDNGRIIFRLSRPNIRMEKRRIKTQKEEYDAGRMPLNAILQSYQSWRSYAQRYDAHKIVGAMDKYFMQYFGDAITRENNGKRVKFRHPNR